MRPQNLQALDAYCKQAFSDHLQGHPEIGKHDFTPTGRTRNQLFSGYTNEYLRLRIQISRDSLIHRFEKY